LRFQLDLHDRYARELEPRDRELIALRYGADLSARQIAELLELKMNAVEVALHRDHDDLYHYFDRHNKYSDWEAVMNAKHSRGDNVESQTGTRALGKRILHRIPFAAPAMFVYSYSARLGFFDGRAGLHYALAKAVYHWQIGIKERELRRT